MKQQLFKFRYFTKLHYVSSNCMRFFLIFISLLIIHRNAHAHTVEPYEKTKKGITLFTYISTGSIEERKIQNAFLNQLTESLVWKNKRVPIYLIVDRLRLIHPLSDEWFASIAYDSLKPPDREFIEDYFYYRIGPYFREKVLLYRRPPSDKYKLNLKEPIDLGSSYDDKKAPLGLKIIYNYSFSDSAEYWNRLYTLVQYSIDHIDEIKRDQKKIILPYAIMEQFDETNYNPEVSLLTIDTGLIHRLPLKNLGFDDTKLDEEKSIGKYILIGLLILSLLITITIFRR